MKYELTFNLLLVRLKGRECSRHLAFWTKAELAFPNPGISWSPEATLMREGIIHHYLLTGVTAAQMELPNALASTVLSSYQKAKAWWINKMSECENSVCKGP